MLFLLRFPYAALGGLATAGAALAPDGDAKWVRALRARRGILKRYRAFAPLRDPARALAWFHAPSVGESLMALPVVQRIRAGTPVPQTAVTWYSPSAESFAMRFDADFRDYLPFDTTHAAREALAALRPTALVFSKLDVWPVLVREASRAGVRLGLISASVRSASGRLGPLARGVLRDAYAALDVVGAVAGEDAERLIALGVRPEVIRVTGDTRYDQARERADRLDRTNPLYAGLESERPTLVAGSTWPSDEAVLTAAWERLRAELPHARLIIAPHEPSPGHVTALAEWAARSGLRVAAPGGPGVPGADVVLVDRVGFLADLYAFGQATFVGGGFHAAGLHSVVEPAAHGRPVAFGPGARGSADAERLVAAGGGALVTNPDDLCRTLRDWLGNAQECRLAGEAAAGVVRSGMGAADRSAGLVRELLIPPTG